MAIDKNNNNEVTYIAQYPDAWSAQSAVQKALPKRYVFRRDLKIFKSVQSEIEINEIEIS